MGKIYILTNPSFPEWVKIGYADDLEKRVKQLNNSTATPFGFRIYATYEVEDRLKDLKLHEIIDKLNPNLRSRDVINGKSRVREFFAMTKEDAYSLFEAIAQISGTTNKLSLPNITETSIAEEREADEIREDVIFRKSNFIFSDLGILPGAILTFKNDENITVEVADDRKVIYKGLTTSLSSVATELTNQLGYHGPVNGARWFMYNGKTISELRSEFEGSR